MPLAVLRFSVLSTHHCRAFRHSAMMSRPGNASEYSLTFACVRCHVFTPVPTVGNSNTTGPASSSEPFKEGSEQKDSVGVFDSSLLSSPLLWSRSCVTNVALLRDRFCRFCADARDLAVEPLCS